MGRRSLVIVSVLWGSSSSAIADDTPQILALTGGSFAVPAASYGDHFDVVTQFRAPISSARGFWDEVTAIPTSPATNTHARTGGLALGGTSLDVFSDVTTERVPTIRSEDAGITRDRLDATTIAGGFGIRARGFSIAARVLTRTETDALPATTGGGLDLSGSMVRGTVCIAGAVGTSVLMGSHEAAIEAPRTTRMRMSALVDVGLRGSIRAGGYVIADAETWLDHYTANRRQREDTFDAALYVRGQIKSLPQALLAAHAVVMTDHDTAVELTLLVHFDD